MEKHCGTQRLVVPSEAGFVELWNELSELHPTERQERIARIALREFVRSDIDQEKNCIVSLFLNPDKPNDGEDIVIVRAFDAHMVYLRRQEETSFLLRFPNLALKSGSANPDSFHTRFECDATYPVESWLSGIPMWNRKSVTSSSFIVTKPGIDGMIEGSFILLLHREMRNTNINPESFSSTKNGRTSVSFHRMFYFMAVEESDNLDVYSRLNVMCLKTLYDCVHVCLTS